MADTTFVSGTVITKEWLNDVNRLTYDLPSQAVSKGAALVGMEDPSGIASTAKDQIQAANNEFAVSAWSQTASSLQTGPLIVNMSRKLRITGTPADSAYNKAVIQDVLSGLPHGAELEFPSRGLCYSDGGLVIDSAGVSFRGRNAGGQYDSFWLKFTDTGDALTINQPGFHTEGMLFVGASNLTTGFGNDVTHDCFNFVMPGVDCDSSHMNSGFFAFRDCATVKSAEARNFKFTNCLFSGSQRAFSYTATGTGAGRGFEFYSNRFHGIGREGHARAAVLYFEPASNTRGLIVSGGMVDFSVELMRGYASGSDISSVPMIGAQRSYVELDFGAHTQSALDRGLVISNGRYAFDNSIGLTGAKPAASFAGNGYYELDGFVSYGSRGHGIEINTSFMTVANTLVHNASQAADMTYSGYYIAAGAVGADFGGSVLYRQGRKGVPANKAKYGFENLGADTIFRTQALVDNVTAGTEYYIDITKKSFGPDPRNYSQSKRVAFATAAPGSGTGNWNQGDVVINTSPDAAGVSYWQAINGGTNPTWKTVSLSA